jgi:hypothetical protein
MLPRALLAVAILSFPLETSGRQTSSTEIAGRSVQMTVVKAQDLTPTNLGRDGFKLSQNATKITPGSNVLLQLRENGIAPDSEALTLVYDLNPAVRDLNNAPDGRLILPVVQGDQESRELLKNGYLVELTVDPQIRRRLNGRIESLQQLVPSISAVATDAATQKQITDTIGWFDQIEKRYKRRTGPPLRHATLLQMQDESEQLDLILKAVVQRHTLLTPDERNQIGAIFEDMKTEIGNFDQVLADVVPGSQQYYSVTVTVKSAAGRLPGALRVYYTFNGLFRPLPADPPFQSFGFHELGSGKTESLLMKNYQIWGAKDGDPNHPLTPTYLLRIDESSSHSLSVELSLASGTAP